MKNHQYDEVSDIIRLMALSAMAGNVFHFHYSSIFRSVLMSQEMDVPVIVAVIATSETARPMLLLSSRAAERCCQQQQQSRAAAAEQRPLIFPNAGAEPPAASPPVAPHSAVLGAQVTK